MPEIRKAEMIGGIVYMPSNLSSRHGVMASQVGAWLTTYAAATPGCEAGSDATWLMQGDAPQPDADLRILPEFGGQSAVEGLYGVGAPELAAEVCLSSTSYDLHQKRQLYESAGVQEYLAVLLHERQLRWHRLGRRGYRLLAPSQDGLLHSVVFPGLWLDGEALVAGQMARVLAVLQQGLASPGHAAFAARLARKKGR